MRIELFGVAATLASVAIGCGTEFQQPYDAESPTVYVAKVKNILVGLPPTDDEIQAVIKSPDALGGLVDGWMATPEYQQKMMVFFELAFQQTQISTADFVDMLPPNGLGVGKGLPQLVQNARESFARTVLELTAEGRPFTEAFTTKRLMMTPALMALYAMLDARRVDDTGAITDSFQKANKTLMITMTSTGSRIALKDAFDASNQATYMHFYSPDLPNLTNFPDPTCNGLTTITFPATAISLHDVLYGEIPNHKSPTGGNCANRQGTLQGVQLSPTDFSQWTMVTVRPPAMGEATTFFDVSKLETMNELVLGTPHPGFFSTPAFFANWSTNSSNQMRVTLNQSLIVATGAAIDGSDSTAPTTTPGLDPVHAAPGSACFSCHQLLDPTRSILSATYSWFYYPQTDMNLMNQPGLFAFQGVIAPMTSIDDFANLLATHPLVPSAWAQKLCYYVNSSACEPSDPEFKRIVDGFTSSGMSWNHLLRDIMTSPLTIHTAETVTDSTDGEIIAVSRRDHLCAALNNRLGFVDICQLDATLANRASSTVAQIVSGLPSDGYGRGGTAPILPNDPGLFYRAGLENICVNLATQLIDTAVDPNQPGAKHWSSAQPDAAIADFVSILMALTPSDPRAAAATTSLTNHYTQALAATTTPKPTATDALRSTFITACLSPTFIGIGM